jgi:hypothetical protein
MNAEMATNLRKNIDDIYVTHELRKREAAGTPFADPLWAVQVILGEAGGEPTVRLNAEVRLRVKTKTSDDWVDYQAVPKDGPPQIRQLDLYPDEANARHLTYCLTGVTPEQIVWFEVGDRQVASIMRPAHERASAHPLTDEAWREMFEEHDRVAAAVLGGINSPTPESPVEIIIATALQRSRHLLEAYGPLVLQRNLTAGSALIRMQLDSVMRVNACFLVSDPMDIWHVLREGRRWSSVRDRNGHYLRDVYLHQKLSETFDWASETYERMSGYVHLSRPHLEAATAGEEFLGMQIFQGPAGARVTDEHLNENVTLFMKVTSALLTLCERYAASRD